MRALLTVSLLLPALAAEGQYNFEDEQSGLDPLSYGTFVAPASKTTIHPYVPVHTQCPDQDFVRQSTSIGSQEALYIRERSKKTNAALASWLATQGDFESKTQPTIAFAASGGGLRAFLEAAGVVQAFDGRERDGPVSGLYQAFSYEAGISGGSWFLTSLAGNNWPTITELRSLWHTGLAEMLPNDPVSSEASPLYQTIVSEVQAKQNAGFQTTLVDVYARWIAHGALLPQNVYTRLSEIASLSNFTSHHVPFPLSTSVGIRVPEGECMPAADSPQYEVNPFEFGSWDAGVQAFTPTKYLGTRLRDGQPLNHEDCIVQYDDLGFTSGASSNVFPKFYCDSATGQPPLPLTAALEDIVALAHPRNASDIFALYPNPFWGFSESPLVKEEPDLYLVDGGFVGSDVPIWPFIQEARDVDVVIAADSSEDTWDNLPDGTQIRFTYEQAVAQGLPKMPFVPSSDVFVAQGLHKRATFFGCDDHDKITLIFLPNVPYSFPSNQSSLRVGYTPEDIDGMIDNGVLIGTQNNDPDWPLCLACGIKAKDDNLPADCKGCLKKYCYRE